MSLTSEEIAGKEFLVGLRGYDKDEVRAFLRTVASAFDQTSADAAGAPAQQSAPEAQPAPAAAGGGEWSSLGDEIAAVLRTAHEQAAALKAATASEVASLRSRAEQDAAHTRAEAEAEAQAARAAAEQDRADAATTLTAAQDQALALVADARARVDTMLESSRVKAETEARAAVAHLTSQVDELNGARDVAAGHLRNLRVRIDKALANAEAPLPAPRED